MKSFRPKDGGDVKLYRKAAGQASRMAFMGHVLMENRNGLVVAAALTQASGAAEHEAALAMLDATHGGQRRVTLGADKGYDVTDFVGQLRDRKVTPPIAVDGHRTKTGKRRVGWMFTLTAAAYNLARLPKLIATA